MAKIAFIWYWDKASQIMPNWRDGLRAALEEIEKRGHTIDWFLDEKIPEDEYDAYIIWGDSNCRAIDKIRSYKGKKAICLTTNPTNVENLRGLDAVYCESNPVLDEVRRAGLRAIKAFGTDTDFFRPEELKKTYKYFYPATFSPWKNQSAIAHYGDELLCIGTLQPDGQQEYDICLEKGVNVRRGYFKPELIRNAYNRCSVVIIPAIHGSERTVLEAMASGLVPLVNPSNRKAHSYIHELEGSKLSPRDFVLKNYSPKVYADNILKGIL